MRLLVILSVAAALVGCKLGSDPYTISSKAKGAPFDLVVTEIQRTPNKTYISVPGFHTRTAPGSRWLMCVYTDIAMRRGYSHWLVSYPPADSDVLVVGLTNSGDATAQEVLGSDYKAGLSLGACDGQKPMSVSKMGQACGFDRR